MPPMSLIAPFLLLAPRSPHVIVVKSTQLSPGYGKVVVPI